MVLSGEERHDVSGLTLNCLDDFAMELEVLYAQPGETQVNGSISVNSYICTD